MTPHLSLPLCLSQRVEHCGYLTKLDLRLRPGKRRWFVLTGTELRYYRNKESSFGRPRKIISLNSWCKLAVMNDVVLKVSDIISSLISSGLHPPPLQLTTSSQTYHLSAETVEESECWVQALRRVLQSPSELVPSPSHSLTSPPLDVPSTLSSWAHVVRLRHHPLWT